MMLTKEQEKLFIQQCLMEAEKFIRNKRIDEARIQIEKAKSVAPNNVYIKSFSERIQYLEKRHHAAASPQQQIAREENHLKPVSTEYPLVSTPSIYDVNAEKTISELRLEEMQRQVEILQKAVEEEKRARNVLSRSNIQQGIDHLRDDLRTIWLNGVPVNDDCTELKKKALAISIPERVMNRLQREVKIEMFGKAVKEITSKKHLVRNVSSSVEWLRKVYDISAEEYLEYETKFLADLSSDHYKGTVFLISSDEHSLAVITQNLKAQGYAIVISPSPEEALEKIEKLTPTVIVSETEFGFHNISGIRFLHFLRNNSKFNFIPFIFVAGEEDYSLLSSSELRSNEGFVKKPVIFNELFSVFNAKLQWFQEYSALVSK